MADQQQLDLLRQGVEAWNKWRIRHDEVRPDLSRADLSRADLSDANLSDANLSRADLSGADLTRADLSRADLSRASLYGANLSRADLSDANLIFAYLNRATLNGATLNGADLNRATLNGATLNGATLNGADLNGARVSRTIFGNLDLRTVKGLETITHDDPSTIGTDTIMRSEGDIPEVFLRKAGLSDTFITYARSLVLNPIEYYTCFISYSSKDQEFAKRLYADLQREGVLCWFAPEDLDVGEKIRPRIDETIRLYDKLLIVLSEHSIASHWVAYEVEKALDKEPEGVPNVLFPIRLDESVLICETQWAKNIQRSRHIGDFECWKEHDAYQKSFRRLLRALNLSKTKKKET